MNPYRWNVWLPIIFALLVLFPAVSQSDGEGNAPPAWISGYITRLEARVAEADRSIRRSEEIIGHTWNLLEHARRENNAKAETIADQALKTVQAAKRKSENSRRRAMLTIGGLKRLANAWGSPHGQGAARVFQSGKVEIRRQGQEGWNDLGDGKDLFLRAGDQVRTGDDGKATFHMDDGSLINIDRNSTVEIEGPDRIAVTLGVIQTQIRERLASKFEVRTPSAVTSVRGTGFVVDVRKNGDTEVTVLEGSVWVRGPAGDGEVVAEAGNRVLVPSGRLPGPPQAIDLKTISHWWEE